MTRPCALLGMRGHWDVVCRLSPHPGPLPWSLGERESRIPSLGKPERIDRVDGLATILPLPEGEGRCVGKGDICHWRIFDGGTNSENCSWSKSFAALI